MKKLWRRFLFLLRRERSSRELKEEIEAHRLMKQDDFFLRGFEPESAAELSRREMGNITLSSEECRNMWSFLSLERLLHDLRYAARIFRRTPVFTAIAVGSLALGIGGNAAMFSLVNALLLRPLPYRAPDRLVRITGVYPRAAVTFFRQQSRAMDIAAVSTGSESNLTGQGPAIRVTESNVSCNFLDVLGTSVAIGRGFSAGEDVPGRDGIVLISNSLWKQRFGGDPGIVGHAIRLDGINREIVGVMPATFSYPSTRIEVWIPMRLNPSNFLEYWSGGFVPFIGRLRPGASMNQAQDEARHLTAEFRKTFPYPISRDWNADTDVVPLQRDIVGDVRGKLMILLAAVGMVLLIACANVANLLLARATTRRKEIALRASLGATRLRIIRQLLTESSGLALLGAVVGIAVGNAALSIFRSVLPESIPGVMQASIDWQVVGAVSALALVTGLAFGLAPALSASQIDLTETIKTGSQRSTAGFWTRFRSYLVVAEVSLTLILAVTAGLLLRSLFELSRVNPGFNAGHILTVRVSPDQSSCVQRSACVALYDRLLEQSSQVPGVSAAGISNSVPLEGDVPAIPVDLEDHPRTADHPTPMMWFGAVSSSYFEMLHIPLMAGRYFTRQDSAASAPVAVISKATARRFWPGESAIGKHIKLSQDTKWRTVVGVVGDTRQYTLATPLPGWFAGAVYMPYAQSEREDGQIPAAMTLLVKSRFDSGQLRNELHQLAKDVDPDIPVGRVRPLEEIVAGSISDFRAIMRVFLSFAGIAIALAAVGIYGLMSYWVSQRTYEIGLRMAIGATHQRIVAMIFKEGLRLSAFGVAAGIVAALMLTRFLQSLLYGVAGNDVITFIGVTALVLCVAVIATAVPAWRASRIDSARSLRAE